MPGRAQRQMMRTMALTTSQRLTPREREILRLVAAGRANAQIAGELGISVSTASVHVSNILAKLDVENRVEAAALAHRLGVIGTDAVPASPR
jgi:DNA-binding NarL/FixJ family response regulator